jgi:hypothetical protein
MRRRRAERIALGGAVLLLHLALLWAWRSGPPLTRDAGAEPAPLIVRLLTALPPTAIAPPPPAPTLPRSAGPSPARVRVAAPAVPDAVHAITAPAPAEHSASAPTERPLDTTLPAAVARPTERSLKDRMLNDPRSNSPRATVEARVADAAGTIQMVEERMDATRMRVKQRGGCIEVHVSRNAQIDPFNQSHLPTPKLVKPSC